MCEEEILEYFLPLELKKGKLFAVVHFSLKKGFCFSLTSCIGKSAFLLFHLSEKNKATGFKNKQGCFGARVGYDPSKSKQDCVHVIFNLLSR